MAGGFQTTRPPLCITALVSVVITYSPSALQAMGRRLEGVRRATDAGSGGTLVSRVSGWWALEATECRPAGLGEERLGRSKIYVVPGKPCGYFFMGLQNSISFGFTMRVISCDAEIHTNTGGRIRSSVTCPPALPVPM